MWLDRRSLMRIASRSVRKLAWPSHNISVFDQCKSKGEEKVKDKMVHQITDLRKDIARLQVENDELDCLRSESARWAQKKINLIYS
ncbi:hypothetical protein ACSQ67_010755 [Phaseolus vulgaris]